MKLVLGTVQFGVPYGIGNRVVQTPLAEVENILRTASGVGISLVDTAVAYGTSEAVLGQILAATGNTTEFSTVSKVAPLSHTADPAGTVCNLPSTVEKSLERLRQNQLYGLLVHRASDLYGQYGPAFIAALHEVKAQGLAERIGFSAYNSREIDRVLAVFKPDLVQVPISILDQRLIKSGHLSLLKRMHVEIHARSVFLKGLLLMDPAQLSHFFAPIRRHLEALRVEITEAGITAPESALGFVRGQPNVDAVVIGVNTADQLRECVAAWERRSMLDLSGYALDEDRFVNPALWPA